MVGRCYPLNILWIFQESFIDNNSSESQERQRLTTFIFVNTIQNPHILRNNIDHSSKRGQPPFFHSDTSLALSHILVDSVSKTSILVVAVELIWLFFLNILPFNFVQRQNKSLRFRRFRRIYVTHPAIVSTNHNQSWTRLLFLTCSVQSGYVSFFAVCSQWESICATYFCWTHLLFECC